MNGHITKEDTHTASKYTNIAVSWAMSKMKIKTTMR